jgi:hypothetical protein
VEQLDRLSDQATTTKVASAEVSDQQLLELAGIFVYQSAGSSLCEEASATVATAEPEPASSWSTTKDRYSRAAVSSIAEV